MADETRKELREKGLKIRREVLGAKYVDAALNNMNEFNAPLQELLNEFCWGGAWGRGVLSRQERKTQERRAWSTHFARFAFASLC